VVVEAVAAAGGSLAKYVRRTAAVDDYYYDGGRRSADDRSNCFDPGVTAVAGVFARILFYACERLLLSVIIFSKLPRILILLLHIPKTRRTPLTTIIF
jgi:hypothetical protein